MATSQNGYSAPISAVNRNVPGGKIPLRPGPAGDLLAWVAVQFHNRVEPLVWPGNWGYAYRDIRGSTGLSNHASGTAIDLNAPKHPLGTNPSVNFTAGQIAAIRSILAQCQGCVRWGGDYTGRKDPMHFEIVRDEATCARVLAAVTSGGGGAAPIEEDDVNLDDVFTTRYNNPLRVRDYFAWTDYRINEMFNMLAGALQSKVDPNAKLRPLDFLPFIDYYATEANRKAAALLDLVAKQNGVTAQAIADALRPGLVAAVLPELRDAVADVLDDDNGEQADAIVEAALAKLAQKLTTTQEG
ncbi:M15 family metallopeptidase [Amycolatopsis sp. NPDC006131]|uniref:M15 family metallopeptidase n=1 Tax=Amycolatopsis sp. NPDC006131 TaxID=3156731 RepID=UPI0033A67CAD